MSFDYKVEKFVRAISSRTGVEEFIRSLYRKFGLPKLRQRIFDKKYGAVNRFEVNVSGLSVYFSTEDLASKRFFFPRYDGGKLHEEPVTLLMLEKIKTSQCFVDIGAGLGWYTCLASKFMPDGIVYAFEAHAHLCKLMQKNLQLNEIHNVHMYHMVVADTTGGLDRARNAIHPDLRLKWPDKMIPVQTITLDDFIRDQAVKPDVIKIDVEGAEIKVLNGLKEIMQNSAPKLFLEVHPQKLMNFSSSAKEVISLMLENGYKVFEIKRMREHNVTRELRELSWNSNLADDTMVYAHK